MQLIPVENGLRLTGVPDFDLVQTFTCGQAFRWRAQTPNCFTGVAGGHVLSITDEGEGTFLLSGATKQEFHSFWKNYLSLDTDYGAIKQKLSRDSVLRRAIAFGSGIRILNQEPFECLLSFILSQSNNIARIAGIVDRFAREFGHPVSFMGETYYTFPTPRDLIGIELEDLAPVRAGFRDKYLLHAIRRIQSGDFSLERARELPTDPAREYLKTLRGVGDKVANCVLIFGLGHTDAFPVDVWIKRIMEHAYFDGQETTRDEIAQKAAGMYGEYGGYAQQYLFYYARELGLGKENKS